VAAVPRSSDFSIESKLSVEQIHSAFSQEDYWLARQVAFGDVGRLDSFVVDTDGSVHAVIKTDMRDANPPGLVAHLYPRSWQTVHEETWSPAGEGEVRGEINFATHGAPGSGMGTALLTPTQNGSRLKGRATVEFRVPLIGGKVEGVICRQLVEQLSQMLRFTEEWVTENA
jgi:hypothetical protein